MRLAILAASLLSFVHARVSFKQSTVLQAPDLGATNKATFKCANACKVFADRKSDLLVVTQNGNLVASLSTIVGSTVFTPFGFLLQAGDYALENKGEINPEFVLYVVDSNARNNGASVVAPQDTVGVAVNDATRCVTVLSRFEAVWFSGFTGKFPDGYPKIYASGYDAAYDQCNPVYQARSQYNAEVSWPMIATAVMTIDFGYSGVHNVSVNSGKLKDMDLNGGTTAVFTSPGYVGCSSTPGQNYYSKLSKVDKTFTVFSDGLDIDGAYSGLTESEPVRLVVNNQLVNLVGTDGVYNAHYKEKTFGVSVSWTRQTAYSNFALQLDFGNANDPGNNGRSSTTKNPQQSTTSTSKSLTFLSALALVIAICLW